MDRSIYLVFIFSVTINAVEHYGDTHCLVDEEGNVLWVPPTQFLAFCDLDLRLWPFDTQTCSLILGSWTYSGDQIDLHLFKKPMEVESCLLQFIIHFFNFLIFLSCNQKFYITSYVYSTLA